MKKKTPFLKKKKAKIFCISIKDTHIYMRYIYVTIIILIFLQNDIISNVNSKRYYYYLLLLFIIIY